ncbi:uncharacterized protein [Triticum aestivum]|uniref:uncharacterized protein isoform X2 n=1 Tax=Triticum aestivum TaxID=4565 RepID=UPI001D029EE6|nr:uncharacterized protein LOC123119402 isoform X2 [Triticum aestivum]
MTAAYGSRRAAADGSDARDDGGVRIQASGGRTLQGVGVLRGGTMVAPPYRGGTAGRAWQRPRTRLFTPPPWLVVAQWQDPAAGEPSRQHLSSLSVLQNEVNLLNPLAELEKQAQEEASRAVHQLILMSSAKTASTYNLAVKVLHRISLDLLRGELL